MSEMEMSECDDLPFGVADLSFGVTDLPFGVVLNSNWGTKCN